MIRIIDHPTIMSLKISPEICMKWVDTVLREKNAENAGYILPSKISMKPELKSHFHNVMPCVLSKYGVIGTKEVSRVPERLPALDSHITLTDMDSGNLIALLDGNYITAMRTGAVAVYSAILLGKKEFSKIGIIGLGVVANSVMEFIRCTLSDRKITMYLYSYKNQAEVFAKKFSNCNNIEFMLCDTYEQVIENSEVLFSCVTAADKNFCEDINKFSPGCTVIPVHTLGFQNCDIVFDKIYGDDTGHIHHFRFFDQFKSFGEVADVVMGKIKGRENGTERILVYNIGLSVFDIYFAHQIYNMTSTLELPEFDLKAPKEKLWL